MKALVAASAGFDPQRLERVRVLFAQQQKRGLFPGGQLVIRRHGQLAINFATGIARGFRREENEAPVEVTPQTRFLVCSASKPVTALALAMLEERGIIDVNAPVAKWFPEFAANGKEDITVLDVLTHRASVFTPELLANPRAWGNEALVRKALIEAKPRLRRGTLAYMPYEFGWILAEVVRRATGRGLEEFIREEIATPAGIPGLRFGATLSELTSIARLYWLGTNSVKVAGTELSKTFEAANNLPEVLTAFVPAAGLVCTANDLAEFYAVLAHGGVCRSGQRLVSKETLQRYTTAHTSFDRSNRMPLRVGRGFLLGNVVPSIYGWWGTQRYFGHAGAFCTLAYADPDRDLAVAIVTNGNWGAYESLFRFAPLGSAIRKACL